MRMTIPLAFLLLALPGCVPLAGDTMLSVGLAQGGRFDAAQATVVDGGARFRCLHSTTGRCHYLVYRPECSEATGATPAWSCETRAVLRFELASGQSREVRDLDAGATWCMDPVAPPRLPGCRAR